MSEGDGHPDRADHRRRGQTNESLRNERDKSDEHYEKKRDAVELEADEVMRLARRRADEVVQSARDDADERRADLPRSATDEAAADRERQEADLALDRERTQADALVDHERAERRRYLSDFVLVERDTTDSDLVGERAHMDLVIAARDEVLATVSHDLRNGLATLALHAAVVREQAPDGERGDRLRKSAATSARVLARMNRLINDLLDVSRIEAGKLEIREERVEVADLLRETLDAFAPIAAAKGITVEADGAATPTHAHLDAGRILQVLANVVSNALKFTAAGGTVLIKSESRGSQIAFSVRDTGVGIPEAALQRVFERFHQLRGDRRGLGLGLHISKCIVEAHGGRMWAESEPGAGSTFHFTLPVDRPSAPEPIEPLSDEVRRDRATGQDRAVASSPMIYDVALGSSDLERSAVFYDAALGALGYGRSPASTESWIAWGPTKDDGVGLWLTRPFDGRPPTAGNGTMITFRAKNEAEVHAFHAAALAHGGTDEGAPGTRPAYQPTFYVAYVRDPDGNKLACVFDRHEPG